MNPAEITKERTQVYSNHVVGFKPLPPFGRKAPQNENGARDSNHRKNHISPHNSVLLLFVRQYKPRNQDQHREQHTYAINSRFAILKVFKKRSNHNTCQNILRYINKVSSKFFLPYNKFSLLFQSLFPYYLPSYTTKVLKVSISCNTTLPFPSTQQYPPKPFAAKKFCTTFATELDNNIY